MYLDGESEENLATVNSQAEMPIVSPADVMQVVPEVGGDLVADGEIDEHGPNRELVAHILANALDGRGQADVGGRPVDTRDEQNMGRSDRGDAGGWPCDAREGQSETGYDMHSGRGDAVSAHGGRCDDVGKQRKVCEAGGGEVDGAIGGDMLSLPTSTADGLPVREQASGNSDCSGVDEIEADTPGEVLSPNTLGPAVVCNL